MSVALSNLGAVITLGLGVLGLFVPTRAASFANVQPVGLIGTSEIRATYGGLFVALGVACLLTQAPGVFLAAGLAWVGAAVGRLFSVFIDSSRSGKNLGGIVFELAIGLLLLSQHLAAA
jgi:hypothetical protein